jgi:ADP-heptose:LPS heptosyltransferase
MKRKFPESHLTVQTKYPEILQYNPYVDEIITSDLEGAVDIVFNLMYELHPDTSIVEAYGKITQLSINHPEVEFYMSEEEKEEIDRFMKTLSIENFEGMVVIHPMSGNRIKWWSRDKYQEVSDYVCARNFKVATVGSPFDCVELRGAINLIGKLSLRQSAALISRAKLFIGLDSFPMHIANAFKVPSIILFGSTDPKKVLVDSRMVRIIKSSEYCLGCRLPGRYYAR